MDGNLIQLSDLVVRWIWRIHEEEDSNIWVGALIIWCKPNCGEIFSIALPSVVITSFLQQLLDFTSKSPRSNASNGLFCTADSRLTQGFL